MTRAHAHRAGLATAARWTAAAAAFAVLAAPAVADAALGTAPPASGLVAAPAPVMVPGDRVLCLYDASEGSTPESNPLSGAVANGLRRQGFQVQWRDAAGAPPTRADLAGLRAVVTGFKDGRLRGARRHVEFVREAVDAGVRYVVVGAFGAFQEDADGAFLPADVVNRALEALGVRYDAWWTDDPARFQVRVESPALGPADAVRPGDVRHFYQFTVVRPDVEVLVSGRRTDADLPPSALVFSSATGALALSRYLSADESLSDARQARVDLQAFLVAALARRPADPATLLVIADPAAEDGRRALAALRAAAWYAGTPLVAVSTSVASGLRPMDLQAHGGVVVAVPEMASPLDEYLAGLLRDHASRGGRAVSVLPLRNRALARSFGDEGGTAPAAYRGGTLRFADASFPGLGGFRLDLPDDASLSGLRPVLSPRCTPLALSQPRDGGPEVPVWWRCPAGRGEVTALNAWELSDRATLGVVVQLLLDAEGRWAMPALAAAVEFVDDCPLPMTGNVLPALGKRDTDYYLKDFLPTLREMAAKHRFRPTSLAVFTYDDKVRGPYGDPWPGPAGADSRRMAATLLADDFPVGLHGMTHVSPALSGGVTTPFPDEAALRDQFAAARRSFADSFGPENRPAVFVPPNDWIDAAGKRALAAAVPDARVLSSVFAGSDVETSQDFAADPDVPSLTALPRTWAGMSLSGEPALGMVNGLLLRVVSTHFVHPDDALDPERAGGLAWPRLRESWMKALDDVYGRFPYLRRMTALQAADEVRRQQSTGLRVHTAADGTLEAVRAAGQDAPLALLARLPAGCRPEAEGGTIIVADPVSGRHLVRMEQRVLALRCQGVSRGDPSSPAAR